jgi:hypothetical protein
MLSTSNDIIFMTFSYLSIIAIIYYIYYKVDLASNDPLAFTKNLNSNIFFIVLPVIAIFALMSVLAFNSTVAMYIIFGGIFAAAAFGFVFYLLQSSLSKYIFNIYLLYFVTILLFIVGGSILATLFSGSLRKMTGWTGFFINLLFYLPCLIRDLIHGAIQEYQSFSTTLVVLFSIEIILGMMFLFLIPFVNNKILPSNVQLLEDPVMLNTAKLLETPNEVSDNFAISMWVYVNPASINKPGYAVETPIFTYMTPSGEKHIRLTYSNIEQGNNDFIMYIGDTPFPLSLPLQKWNNFVFNHSTYTEYVSAPSSSTTPSNTTTSSTSIRSYINSWWSKLLSVFYKTPASTPAASILVKKTTVDMFVNGILERSFTYDDPSKVPIFSPADRMVIARWGIEPSSIVTHTDGVKGATNHNSNHEGLYGAICNVVYYGQPLTQMALIYNYNLLTIRNPPL